jgi:hypothetical protein
MVTRSLVAPTFKSNCISSVFTHPVSHLARVVSPSKDSYTLPASFHFGGCCLYSSFAPSFTNSAPRKRWPHGAHCLTRYSRSLARFFSFSRSSFTFFFLGAALPLMVILVTHSHLSYQRLGERDIAHLGVPSMCPTRFSHEGCLR